MANKEVTDRDASTTTAVSMMKGYAPQVQDGMAAALSPYLEDGEKMPDIGFEMVLLSRMIAAHRDELVAADAANERERADDAKPRRERDQFARRAFELLVATRDTVGANYGVVGLTALGMREPCPDTPHETARYGRQTIDALRDPKVVLPPPRSQSLKIDRTALAAEIEAEVVPLEARVQSVTTEETEAKGTQARKNAALAANDRAFSAATGIARYTFLLCGLADLAGRIREAPRSPGRLEKPADRDATE